ncbi:hypothetical protein HD554DRAFT_1091682 [Boletus coccyginus]|nr:hypothetical protein HD554DRAFT_1091682 [Boletus coccyginus]
MKMILFRPTFVSAGTFLQATALSCIFLSMTSGKSPPISSIVPFIPDASVLLAVSAVPQFGRPLMRVLDEESTSSLSTGSLASVPPGGDSTATSSTTGAVPSVVSTVTSPTVTSDQINTATAATSIAPTATAVAQSSSASHSLCGVHTAFVLSAAASALLLVV